MISAVMACLDCADYVEEAAASVLQQRGVELELVIQDGGSRDGTLEILRSIGDPRIHLESRADQGQSEALNRAIQRARGDWIVWINADDRLSEGSLRAALDMAPERCELIIGDFEVIDGEGSVLKESWPPPLLRKRLLRRGCYVFSGACMFRSSVFERFGGLETTLHFAMDYEYLLRIAPSVDSARVPLVLGQYRSHGASKTSTRSWLMLRELLSIRRRYSSPLGWVLGGVPVALNQVGAPLFSTKAWRLVRPRGGMLNRSGGADGR